MEPHIQELISTMCGRPRHFRVDQWYDWAPTCESQISYKSRHHSQLFKNQKANRRLKQWRHKETTTMYASAPSSDKLTETKRRHFMPEGKSERVARAITALNKSPAIQLSPEQCKEIAEALDLEDQFS